MYGTKEPIQHEIADALGMKGKKREDITASIKNIATAIRSTKNGPEIEVVSKIYFKQGNRIKETFEKPKNVAVDTETEVIDIVGSDDSSKIINKWCTDFFSKENTKNKETTSSRDIEGSITDFFGENLIDETSTVLVNAIYLRAPWLKKFVPKPKQVLCEELFRSDESALSGILIPFMKMSSDFNYGENDELNCQVIQLFFEGDSKLSMFILLPRSNLADLEKRLIGGKYNIKQVKDGCKKVPFNERCVDLALPKFKITYESNLKEILPKVHQIIGEYFFRIS